MMHMNNNVKQIIMNVGIAGAAGVALGPLGLLSSPILAIAGLAALAGTAVAGNVYFIKQAEDEESNNNKSNSKYSAFITEESFNKLKTPEDFAGTIAEISRLPSSNKYPDVAYKIKADWETFNNKKKTLDTLIVNNGSYDTATADAEYAIVSNMKAFIKRVAILQTETDDKLRGEHIGFLIKTAENVHKIIIEYTNLLIEVSKLDDGQFDNAEERVKSLNKVISSINSYRVHNKEEQE